MKRNRLSQVFCSTSVLTHNNVFNSVVEGGTDVIYIQELLGHKSSKTTEIYTYVSNKDLGRIKSPLDNLVLKVAKL